MRGLVRVGIHVPAYHPVLDDILWLVEAIAVELPRLIEGSSRLATAVIEHVLEGVIPQSEQMADKRLGFPSKLTHKVLKLAGKPDLVLFIKIGDLHPCFVAADWHLVPLSPARS